MGVKLSCGAKSVKLGCSARQAGAACNDTACTNFACSGCVGLGCPAGPPQQEQAWWDATRQPPTCPVWPPAPAAWRDSGRQLCLLVRHNIACLQSREGRPLSHDLKQQLVHTMRSRMGVALCVGMHSAAVLLLHWWLQVACCMPGATPVWCWQTHPRTVDLKQLQSSGPAVAAAEIRLPAPPARAATARVAEPISLPRQAPQVASPPSHAAHAVEAVAAPAVQSAPQMRHQTIKVLRPNVAALLLAATTILFLGVALVCVGWTVRTHAQPGNQKPRWMAPNLPGGLGGACRSAVQTTAQYCGQACSHPVVQVCSWLLEPRPPR